MHSTTAPTVLTELKAATAAEHVAIEKSIDWERRFATREGYGQFLRAWRAFYAAAEATLARQPWAEVGYDFEARRKTGWLEYDLAQLHPAVGRVVPDLERFATAPRSLGEGGSVPSLPSVPQPANLAEAIGACYVLEGATLGGQFISRQLNGLGITPATGGSFYAGYGPLTGERWTAFRQMATAHCHTPERVASAVAGAKAMFAALSRWADQIA